MAEIRALSATGILGLFSDSAFKRDLRLMLLAGRPAGRPVLVVSARTGGPGCPMTAACCASS